MANAYDRKWWKAHPLLNSGKPIGEQVNEDADIQHLQQWPLVIPSKTHLNCADENKNHQDISAF